MRISKGQIMVRPTLFVGLGGTGVLACRWVEEFLRRLLGRIPPFVRFLKLDTDALEEGGPTNASQSDFINLFHHMDLGEVVRDFDAHPELHPHLDWLRGFQLDSSIADHGCQGIPRLGRLVFCELRETLIHEEAVTRLGSLRSSTQEVFDGDMSQFAVASDGAPCVHLISSVCGGTGAGMLIDMAYNLRWWSREAFPRNAEIIGHLVLPEAFNVDPMVRPMLEAVAGALLEQLEFLADSRRDDIHVRYRDGERAFDRLTPPFNFLYVLNGQGDTGVGMRKHLTKMIARAIRSMVIEPMGQHFTSDANNKLNHVLGLLDAANGRRRCFASYGFWCARPGHREANVEGWICTALESMGSGTKRGQGSFVAEIGEALAEELREPDVAESASYPGGFSWNPAIMVEKSPDEIEAELLGTLHEYLDAGGVGPASDLRKSLESRVPPDEPNQALMAKVDELIEREVSDVEKPFDCVADCLNEWEAQLDAWLKAPARRGGKPSQIVGQIENRLRDLVVKKGPSWLSDPGKVSPEVDRVLRANWRELAEAVARENGVRSVRETLNAIRLRKQALMALVHIASGGHVLEVGPGTSSSESGEQGGNRKWEDHVFSTPLYSATNPSMETRGDLALHFRQKLIQPILRDVLLSLRKARTRDSSGKTVHDTSGDVDSVKESLRQSLRKLRNECETFLQEAASEYWLDFHSSVPEGTTVPDHKYYRPVCDVLRLAEPKIDLARSGVFAKTLDVGISQHRDGTCVPELLAYNVGSTFREAHMTGAYEVREDVWFQLLRLRYGFCLEAISTYSNYTRAAEDYVLRRGFGYADLWMDSKWYAAYQDALEKWRRDRGGCGPSATQIDRDTYNALALQTHACRSMATGQLAILENAIKQNVHAVDKAFDAGRRLERTRAEIEEILNTCTPARPEHLREAKITCVRLLQQLHAELFQMLDELTEPDRVGLRGALGSYQQRIEQGARQVGLDGSQQVGTESAE